MAREGLRHRHALRRGKRIDGLAAKRELLGAGGARRLGQQRRAVVHQRLVGLVRPVPFQHGEFRMMQRAALAVAEHAGEIEDARLAGRQQLLAGEFRRGAQIERLPLAAGSDQLGGEGMQMGLVAGRDLQGGGLDLDEIARGEPGPQSGRDAARAPAGYGRRAACGAGQPERRALSAHLPRRNGGGKDWHRARRSLWCGPKPRLPRRPQTQGSLS